MIIPLPGDRMRGIGVAPVSIQSAPDAPNPSRELYNTLYTITAGNVPKVERTVPKLWHVCGSWRCLDCADGDRTEMYSTEPLRRTSILRTACFTSSLLRVHSILTTLDSRSLGQVSTHIQTNLRNVCCPLRDITMADSLTVAILDRGFMDEHSSKT